MPNFKYIVGNSEGKKLSGTVEAENELTARTELNNLGFSILSLHETDEKPKTDTSLKKFIFEAIDKNSCTITGTIPAKTEDSAFNKLQSEYSLNVTAIWAENTTEIGIEEARRKGSSRLQQFLAEKQKIPKSQQPETQTENLEEQKKGEAIKAKIEYTLQEVTKMLQTIDKDLDAVSRVEINKKIDKLLRIKHSSNLDYILTSAEELLKSLIDLEYSLKEKISQERHMELEIKTKELLSDLTRSTGPKSLAEDVITKIDKWQTSHTSAGEDTSVIVKTINSILSYVKKFFETPKEILAIKEQIASYNKQLWALIKLYFKEPTKEYKEKVISSIKTVWAERKRAKENLVLTKKMLKEKKKTNQIYEEPLLLSFLEELTTFTGWLLFFYITYYFTSLYLNTKNFGIGHIPQGFTVYDSRIFKYVVIIIFLLHCSASVKTNFFRKSVLADIILLPVFLLGTIITLLNF